ncbi:cytochrome-c peroxidase [Methylomonas sp. HW2-6]|uniref:cytochrome-c peroxidase n=1 Tax=Methylomonas sp. HW2-6 TaxID=3376687 RepID=UPI004041FED8
MNKKRRIILASAFLSAAFSVGSNAEIAPSVGSLKTVPVPTPSNLSRFVKNQDSLVQLGKALFWDNAAGFKGQACASCHFHAGADSRFKNQISPHGASGNSDFDAMKTGSGGPNYTLKTGDFPLFSLSNPADRNSTILYDTDDTVTSMGTFQASVSNLPPSSITGKDDDCKMDPDITFHVNGYNTRKVEPRNTPSTINAVFNFRQFWDGRANNEFNGVDPFGPRNPNAVVRWHNGNNTYSQQTVEMTNASLASQAVGPILSTLEMNCAGKQISHVGRKLLPKQPLELQRVSTSDSVLGHLAKADKGLNTTYRSLVQAAFHDGWWNGGASIDGFSQIESNFSLFYGLALQAYQATLVSNDSKFDQYMDGNSAVLNSQEQAGLDVFLNKGKCVACHNGPELSAAATRLQTANAQGALVERMHMANLSGATVDTWNRCADSWGYCLSDGATHTYRFVYSDGRISPTKETSAFVWCYEWFFTGAGNATGRCEKLTRTPAKGFVALYDSGFYNIGVTPTVEDIGVGAGDPWGNPLSFTRQEKFRAGGNANLAPDNFFTDPNRFELNPGSPVTSNERDAVDGAFKTPILRNVELTGPYMHNGDQLTLEQLVEFYNRGGNWRRTSGVDQNGSPCDTTGLDKNCSNLDPDITSLGLSSDEKTALVAFLRSLTDERVRWEKAPFDHPELIIPLGHIGDENFVETELAFSRTVAKDDLYTLPAIGRDGRQAAGLQPIPAVQNLIACGETDSVKGCFTKFYGDAKTVAPSKTWQYCSGATGLCLGDGTNRSYRFVYNDGRISNVRDTQWHAWCYEWYFQGTGNAAGYCQVLK